MRIGSAFVLSAAVALCACGGSSNSGGGSCNPGATAAFTIKSTGISPAANCVQPNGSVSFTNTDTSAHTVSSSDCSELNALGSVAPNNGSVTATFGAAQKTCTFSVTPGTAAFLGTLGVTTVVQSGPGY